MPEQEPPIVDYADKDTRRPLIVNFPTPRGWLFWGPLAAILLIIAMAIAYWAWPERDRDAVDNALDGPAKVKVWPGR